MSIQSFLESYSAPSHNALFSGFQFAFSDGVEVFSGVGGFMDKGSDQSEINSKTLFDLASLTKLYTATLASILHTKGLFDLDSPISSWSNIGNSLGDITCRELLTHTSGLPAWWEEQESRQKTIDELLSLAPDANQRGTLLYSCTGYSLFSVLAEQKYSMGFDELIKKFLSHPIGLENTHYNPPTDSNNIARSELGTPLGIVHDPRARAMDGVSGNAGLFANATDVLAFLSELINPDSQIITDAVRKELFTPNERDEWNQAIGFRHMDEQRLGNARNFFSHSGFTGTLAMVDTESRKVGVMLSNRLTYETDKDSMAKVYRGFAERVKGD